mmetsp:Transcript_54661/g.116144  ORF Transcript_54661/g.116144 Transcript_54661/m.116144 type:complete len:212 (+) Transcript_54661:1244-1879(+)
MNPTMSLICGDSNRPPNARDSTMPRSALPPTRNATAYGRSRGRRKSPRPKPRRRLKRRLSPRPRQKPRSSPRRLKKTRPCRQLWRLRRWNRRRRRRLGGRTKRTEPQSTAPTERMRSPRGRRRSASARRKRKVRPPSPWRNLPAQSSSSPPPPLWNTGKWCPRWRNGRRLVTRRRRPRPSLPPLRRRRRRIPPSSWTASRLRGMMRLGKRP